MHRFYQIIESLKKKKILVIGDLILDQYIQGSVSRISPEAPVPIVLQEKGPSFVPGGAANVASNLKALGADVALMGRVGADHEAKVLLQGIQKQGIPVRGIFKDSRMPTILKTRIMAQHQQVLRLDRENAQHACEGPTLDKILKYVRANITSLDGIILSDYGKGMITAPLVHEVCRLALRKKKIINVDPKVEHFSFYQGVTCITPNKKETENAIRNIKITHHDTRKLGLTSDRLTSVADVEKAGQQLLKFLRLESLLVTLGEQGMCLFEKGKKPRHIHTRAKEVFDVTGAGDTVVSVFTLALAAGAAKWEAAELANFAAGIVVGKMGVAAVTPAELKAAVAV
ncbi:MAG: D-glycero-beta-D-manno-heptose-7-phosphate kinase [Candidatus Omnitrophota bacterium]|nr:D-glycero-beta-D-manno-heptose-7-phosphate kinase [Candidatus Omnitrophota bacterium]MDZ4243251.1 D-glycero-beta-D-manno-heptose-7-phosphate kinase [Candidatus Omnitrophota bacterium]